MVRTLYVDEVGGARETAKRIDHAFHSMTPEAGNNIHCFWGFARNYRLYDAQPSEQLKIEITVAFDNEDKPMICTQQEMMGDADFWELSPVLLARDGGACAPRASQTDCGCNEGS